MSLIDLKSDLSKFRSKNPKPDNSGATNSPKANSYGDNFSAYQPISNELIKKIPKTTTPKDIDLVKKLTDTKFDDILKESMDGNLVNTVSKLSPSSIEKYLFDKSNRLEKINSKLSGINQDIELSSIDSSNIIVEKMKNGVNNNTSDIKLLSTSDPIDETKINQSVILNKDLVSPINNIINPDIALEKKTLEIDWEAQSALIDKSTDINNVLVNQITNKLLNDSILNLDVTPEKLDTISKIENKKINQTIDTTKYDGQVSDLAISDSKLNIDKIIKTDPKGRHETDNLSDLSNKINQQLNYFEDTNANGFTNKKQLLKTEYKNNTSELGYEKLIETNYFDIKKENTTDGFESFTKLYDTKYIVESSKFNWDGNKNSSPVVNYFDIKKQNTKDGFHSFARLYDTKYIPESSEFDWNGEQKSAPFVNYFDIKKQNTTAGFHKFAEMYDTKYVPGSSRFDWDGKRGRAPVVDYFDLTDVKKTTDGFHKFAQLFDTKYIPESSQFDWDGKRLNAPTNDYFDLVDVKKTTTGFHSFAQMYDTKYVPESSRFDWDGDRVSSPVVNYFDLVDIKKTTTGFHSFAQLYDTKYIPESSEFDWDGNRTDAPINDYFDLTPVKKTTAGFHSFAQLYDTQYIPESSQFDWDGNRGDAKTVDYFDLTSVKKTSTGFNKFAQLYDTKYIPESSDFDWDGNRGDSKIVDYFDLTAIKKTTDGFHKFAQLYDTKYIPESSEFDWDGNRINAKVVDYLDLTSVKKTKSGFHSFAQLYDTQYIPESSQFDWDGKRIDAKSVDYLDLTPVKKTTTGFHSFAQLFDTKYIPESSQFDWNGNRFSSPVVDYFDLTNPKKTTTGFHSFAQLTDTKYIPQSSKFDWDGDRNTAPTVNYFDLSNPKKTNSGFHSLARMYETKFVNNSSNYQWKGLKKDAPSVNYLDLNNQRTFKGFHTFSQEKEPTSYKNKLGVISSDTTNFDWDGSNPYEQTPTRFFGYNQSERFGFVIKMSQFDGTLFPIIKPKFNYDNAVGASQTINRDNLSILRLQSEPLQTSDIEKYVPNTLGNKFVSGKKSSLENQIPVVNIQKFSFDIAQYRRRGTSPSFKKYTEGGGVNEQPSYVDGNMEVWANSDITLPPPSPGPVFGNLTAAQIVGANRSAPVVVYNKNTAKTQIDKQYLKYNLVDQSYNTDPIYLQPFVDTSLNGDDRDITIGLKIDSNIRAKLNSSYDLKLFNINVPDNVRGFIASSFDYVRDAYNSFLPTLQSYRNFDEGLIRGGVVQHTIRTLLDAKRITKFLLSTKGILWNIKQIGLQFMNPMQDTDTGFLGIPGALGLPGGALGLPWTTIYNPLSVPANILGKSILINSKFTRHGVLMYGEGAYEPIAINRNDNTDGRSFDDFTRPSLFNRTSDYNRLVSLTKELLPNSYESITLKKEAENPSFLESVASLAVDFKDNLFTIFGIGGKWNGLPTADGRTTIRRLSTPFGGPNSTLGLFGTTINRATHPYKGVNNTGYFPTRDSILEGKDKEVFYSGKDGQGKRYSDIKRVIYNSGDNSGDESIHGQFVKNQYLEEMGVKVSYYSDGVQKIKADRIQQSKPFAFRYEGLSDRLRENGINYGTFGTMEKQNIKDQNEKSKFRTTPYMKLRRLDFTKRDDGVSDFRLGIDGVTDPEASKFIMDPAVVSLSTNNIESRFGFNNPGHAGRIRNIPYLSNIKYNSLLTPEEENKIQSNYKYEAFPAIKSDTPNFGNSNAPILGSDRINIIDWKRSTKDLNKNQVYELGANIYNEVLNPGKEDLIQFYFSGVNLKGAEYQPTETIVFRAYLDTIVDNHKPTWSPIKYIGRADPVYAYDGYERDINFGFTVHVGSRDELKATWRKLNMLASWTAPEYIDNEEFGIIGTMKAPVIRLNIGNLYRKFPGFLSTLTYTFDNTQTTWETAKLKEDLIVTGDIGELSKPGALELPKTINVQCTFVPFNIYRPEWDCVFYSLFDDETGGTNVETGLVPTSDDRVNYFKTHDDLAMSHPMNSGLCALVPEPRPPQEKKPEEVIVKKEVAVVVEEKPIVRCGCKIVFNKDEERYPVTEASTSLQQIADWMLNDCPTARIELGGHASQEECVDPNTKKPIAGCEPSDNNKQYNKLLSYYRAETVKRILVQDYGIEYDRLTTAGYGFSELFDKNDPSNQVNRRIEIKVTNPEEANCLIKLDLNCKDQTGCPTSPEGRRKQIGDGSEFWIVGPHHFTEGPFDSIPSGDDPLRYDRSPVDNKYYRSILDNWKVKWQNNSYRIETYYTSARKRTRSGGYATWRDDPKSPGPTKAKVTKKKK